MFLRVASYGALSCGTGTELVLSCGTGRKWRLVAVDVTEEMVERLVNYAPTRIGSGYAVSAYEYLTS
eukprot:3358920-Rhodomonas_salina.1